MENLFSALSAWLSGVDSGDKSWIVTISLTFFC